MWFVICMILAGGRLFFAFRPLNGKQNKNELCALCASAVNNRSAEASLR
jgi:hypothetical protein